MSSSTRSDTSGELRPPPVVMIVEDEQPVAEALRRSIASHSRAVHLCASIDAANELLGSTSIDIAIVDHVLGGNSDGLGFLRSLRERSLTCARVLCTGHTNLTLVIDAINNGKIDGFLPKPWDDAAVTAILHQAGDVATLRHRNRVLRAELEKNNKALRDANLNLESQVRERTRSLEATNERLRNYQHELVRLESQAMVTQLVRGLAHELNNPLTVILGGLERLRRRYRDRQEDDLPRRLEILDGEARRCATLVNNLRTYAQPLQERQQSCHIDSLIAEAIERLRTREAAAPADIRVARVPGFSAAPHAMAQVLEAILDNAVRAGAASVDISGERIGDRVVMTIANDGATPGDQEVAQADKPFFCGRNDGSPGLGLSLARSLLGEQGATLAFDRRPGGGAQVVLSLQASDESGELMQRLLAERSQSPILAYALDGELEQRIRRLLAGVQPNAILRSVHSREETLRLLEDGPCRGLIIDTSRNAGAALLQELLGQDVGLAPRCLVHGDDSDFPQLCRLAQDDGGIRTQLGTLLHIRE